MSYCIMSVETADHDLLKKAAAGDRAAFHALYDRYAADVSAYFHGSGLGTADCEDLLQDLFVKLMRQSGWFARADDFRGYLFRVARNLRTDALRKRRTTQTEETLRLLPHPAENGVDAMDAAYVARCLQALEDSQREVVVLHVYSGLSFKEISAALESPLQTVYSRYRAGIQALQEKLHGKL